MAIQDLLIRTKPNAKIQTTQAYICGTETKP